MKLNNIAILKGTKTSIKSNVVHYTPFYQTNEIETNKALPESAEIRTNFTFGQGVIKFKFKAENKQTGVLICTDLKQPRNNVAAGLSFRANKFQIFDQRNGLNDTKGSLNQFKLNQEISMRFEAFGSETKLYINDILYCELKTIFAPFPLSFRITSNGKVSLYDIEVESIRPKLFVVMQFTSDFNNLYNDVIVPVANEAGFEVIRADEFYSSTPILNDIIRSINESSVIIADITPDNPNVFYEIGYSHAMNKPTILICDKTRESLPFDVSSFRTLFYENSISGKTKVENSLRKYLENILNNDM